MSTRVRRALLELFVIFVGVTAAFFVEGYRGDLEQSAQLKQVTDGLLAELRQHVVRSKMHADSILIRVARWEAADAAGDQVIPAYYMMDGSPFPPTPAWDAAISSGVASLYEPSLRLDLGYYFNEFVGIHTNYVRRLSFIEREVLPRARVGPKAFYDASGSLLPEFGTEMELLEDFATELLATAEWADRLIDRLSASAGAT
jgi:hypothetical protein